MDDLKDRLLKPRLSEAEVEVPGVGTVRMRALSRAEVLMVRKATDDENIDGPRALALERKMLATAFLDPVLTEAEVGQWQKASAAGELEHVSRKIQELSGMLEGADKAAFQGVRGGSGDGVRALPGAEAEHDGGPAAG
ncbi:hypothetical protein [Phytohabitans rumicis]|uniref:Uncharacterized protein n=1 Tax=Phytohabitans rumicis TaxID=1076125 RepID=A0A6V8L5T3_9ACTN|nr:hypothetical protein [Phytohabitans rumicis]GFJ91584.1 hypothetical protein Prum_052260 [Phytohabitans rumicis]